MSEENLVSGDVSMSAAPVESASSQVSSAPAPEKLFTQEEVGRIASGARKEAREKTLAEIEAQKNSNQSYQPSQMGGMREPDPAYIAQLVEQNVKRMATEMQTIAQQKSQEEQATAVINEFATRIADGAEKYEDFEDKLRDLDLGTVPNLLVLSNSVDNTSDVMYELANNPAKAYLLNEIAMKNPRAAQLEMKKLSESIKRNQDAMNIRRPNEPLSTIRSSKTSVGSGVRSASDWSKDPRMKA